MRKKLDEYVAMTMEQRIEFLEKDRSKIRKENEKLKNSIEYRKKKANENQEKANEIDKILKIPWILKEDWKIDRHKVAFSHII